MKQTTLSAPCIVPELPDYQSAVAHIWRQAEKAAFKSGQEKSIAGDLWENLVLAYLRNDPSWRREFAEVCVPSGADKGVDLLAKRHDGGLCAIQCKYSHNFGASLSKRQIDSFLGALNNKDYTEGIIAWSGFKVSKNVKEEIGHDAKTPVRLLTGDNFAAATAMNWRELAVTGKANIKEPKKPKGYQKEAVEKLLAALKRQMEDTETDGLRAKLIMACGSGKTFTSQVALERLAKEKLLGDVRLVAYFVPSIALMGQTMRAWSQDENPARHRIQHRFAGICSDPGVGKKEEVGLERQALAQLRHSVATNTDDIKKMLTDTVAGGQVRTLFCTYQSAPQIAEAIRLLKSEGTDVVFDAMFCDEAHRTASVQKIDKDGSVKDPTGWQMPLDDTQIPANIRVFMTATPKVFSVSAKERAAKGERRIWSMDSEELYGPEAYKLDFSDALETIPPVLSDYRVEIIQSPQAAVHKILNKFLESGTSSDEAKKSLDTGAAAQMIGLFNALTGDTEDGKALRKAIVYANTIAASKSFTDVFPEFCRHLTAISARQGIPAIDVRHVDGKMSALERQREMAWLDEAGNTNEIRLLSNAKCLSEGVDVPTLDALCFLQPKGSTIEIVQSVGRVMRQAPLKKYGYVILPSVIPSDVSDYEDHLKKDDHWKTTWAVLRALRSHDDSLAAELAKHEMHSAHWPRQINVRVITGENLESVLLAGESAASRTAGGGGDGYAPSLDREETRRKNGDIFADGGTDRGEEAGTAAGGHGVNGDSEENGGDRAVSPTLPFGEMWQQFPDEALAMIMQGISVVTLEKVGDRQYWEVWSKDAATAYNRILERISQYYETNSEFADEIDSTVADLKTTIGDRSTPSEILSILAQFQVIRPVFNALFGSSQYFEDSPLSKTMINLADSVEILHLDSETHKLDAFYESVVKRAEAIDRPEDRQDLIKHLYEDFIGTAFPAEKKKFGVVYTPTEIVDFILRSVDWSLREELGIADGIAAENVEVLDPFAGTGTFLVRLIQNPDLLPDDKLEHKFRSNLHSNEIMALPYWATEVNMEQAYQTRIPGEYVPYDHGVLADTFTMAQPEDEQPELPQFSTEAAKENYTRATQQDQKKITVIVGNPPWKMAMGDSDYPHIESRVEETYAAKSEAAMKGALYDSYVLAMRWASDRIGNKGAIGFVTNNGWLTGSAAAGLRRVLEEEFDNIHIVNLRGQITGITTEEEKLVEGGGVFPITIGSQIVILSKTGNTSARKHGVHIADMQALSTEEKLARLQNTKHPLTEDAGMTWEQISVDYRGDWLDPGHEDYPSHMSMGDTLTKRGKSEEAMFSLYGGGLKTGMDYLAVDATPEIVAGRGQTMVDVFNHHIATGTPPDKTDEGRKEIHWHRDSIEKLQAKKVTQFAPENIRAVMFRPFLPQYAFYHKTFNSMQYRLDDMYAVQSALHGTHVSQLHAVQTDRRDAESTAITNGGGREYRNLCLSRWKSRLGCPRRRTSSRLALQHRSNTSIHSVSSLR